MRKRKPLEAGSTEPPPGEERSPSGFGRKLKQYFRRLTVRCPTVLESFLGRLELDILEALWAHSNERSVRELQADSAAFLRGGNITNRVYRLMNLPIAAPRRYHYAAWFGLGILCLSFSLAAPEILQNMHHVTEIVVGILQ